MRPVATYLHTLRLGGFDFGLAYGITREKKALILPKTVLCGFGAVGGGGSTVAGDDSWREDIGKRRAAMTPGLGVNDRDASTET